MARWPDTGTVVCVNENFNLSTAMAVAALFIALGGSAMSASRLVRPGVRGQDGLSGSPGVPGRTGTAGLYGEPGVPGSSGQAGAQGASGASGGTGTAGVKGATGATGAIGPVGEAGSAGAKGDTGNIGPAGPDGPEGPLGPVGPVGLTGPEGPIGPAGNGVRPYSGVFVSTVSQAVAPAHVIVPITYNVTEFSDGVTLGSPASTLVFAHAGLYNIQFSAQASKTGPGVDTMDIWPRINGSDVPNSDSQITLTTATDRTIPAWNFIFNLSAGDVVELMMSSSDGTFNLLAIPPQVGPVRPSVPSMIITATRVG